MKNQQSEKSHPFQKLVDVRQAKKLIDAAEGLDEEIIMIDQRPPSDRAAANRVVGSGKGGKRSTGDQPQRRTESRLERRRGHPDDNAAEFSASAERKSKKQQEPQPQY